MRELDYSSLITIRPVTNTSEKTVKMVYWNARSMNNKTNCLYDFLATEKCDVFCLTETWLSCDNRNQATLAATLPEGYKLEHAPRKDGQRGGGVGLIFSEQINVVRNCISKKYDQFELLSVSIQFKRSKINVAVVYRPPPNKKNRLRLKLFWQQWTDFLSSFTTRTQEFIILGDLNFHLDDSDNISTQKFNRILSEFGLVQHVSEPTHVGGHILDVAITCSNSSIVENLSVDELGFTTDSNDPVNDHFALSFLLKGEKKVFQQKTIKYRKWRSIDSELLKTNYETRLISFYDQLSSDQMAVWYDRNLTELADLHAPLVTKKVIRRSNPWYNDQIREMKRNARKLERKWKKTKLMVDKRILKEHYSRMYTQIRLEKVLYTKNKVEECGEDTKKIFSLANHLMGNDKKSVYPSSSSDEDLAEKFVHFFANKVKSIQHELQSSLPDQNILTDDHYNRRTTVFLNSFDLTSEEETTKVIMSLPNKQCKLDPIPTWFLKNNCSTFSPVITKIINNSRSTGNMPKSLKTALVRPILKDTSLSSEDLKNYRPVSNLAVLGKVIEKVVYTRLNQHIQSHNFLDPNQSAYRKDHSAETTLLKLQNDVLCHLDQGFSVALMFIDISAAFDTVSHEKLIKCFNQYFGIGGKALDWLVSYLTGRKQMVVINDAVSSSTTLDCGFPQGANLAGLLYNMSTAPLAGY